MLADLVLDLFRQPRGKARCGKALPGIQQREGAALDGQIHRSQISLIAHEARQFGGKGARLVSVVAQTQHYQRVTQSGIAQPDAPLVLRLLLLFRKRPGRDVQHVVQHAHADLHQLSELLKVEGGLWRECVFHHAGQVD